MHILVDMDDTIANWQDRFDEELHYFGQEALFIPRKNERTCFDLHKDRTTRESEIINEIMDMEGFYADLAPIEGAIDALYSMLAAGHEVSLVTSPWLSNATCVQDKYDWVREHLGDDWVDRVIITKDKTLIEGDVLIDDKPEIHGKAEPKWVHILFDQPYNRYVRDKTRQVGWEDWKDAVHYALIDDQPAKLIPKLNKLFDKPSVFDRELTEATSEILKDGEFVVNKEYVDYIGQKNFGKLGEEVRMTSSTGGQKGKKLAELGSLDPNSLLKVAEVAGFGSQKYDRLNYMKGYEWSLSFDAMQRHLLAFWGGQDKDEESEMLHLAHAAWHCLTMISYVERGLGTDDRYTSMQISQLQTKEVK